MALPIPLAGPTGITTQNLVPAGEATAGSAVELYPGTAAMMLVTVTGTYTGALSLQVTGDGTTWLTITETCFAPVNGGASTATITSAATGQWRVPLTGYVGVRITGLAAMTGTANVSLNPGNGGGVSTDATPGTDQDVNLVGINGVAPSASNPLPVLSVSSTAPSFLSPAPIPATYAADNSVTAAYTLNLTQLSGAWIYPAIGRQAASALTRSAYIAVRPTLNGSTTIRISGTNYDQVSSIAAVGATTLNGATAAGDTTAVLTSATTFAIGDWVCFSSPDTSGLRVEFARIRLIATNTLTFERPLLIAHNNADRVTSAADLFGRVWIPGGDIYSIFGVNNSGQAVIFQTEAATVA